MYNTNVFLSDPRYRQKISQQHHVNANPSANTRARELLEREDEDMKSEGDIMTSNTMAGSLIARVKAAASAALELTRSTGTNRPNSVALSLRPLSANSTSMTNPYTHPTVRPVGTTHPNADIGSARLQRTPTELFGTRDQEITALDEFDDCQ